MHRFFSGLSVLFCWSINHSKIFFDPPPRVMKIKTKINKRDLIKCKTFCIAKESINKMKRQPSEWGKSTSIRCYRVQPFVTPWTAAHQAPAVSRRFSRQGYWSGLPFPSPGDFPDPGIKLRSPALQAGSLPSEPPGKPCEMLAIQSIQTAHEVSKC